MESFQDFLGIASTRGEVLNWKVWCVMESFTIPWENFPKCSELLLAITVASEEETPNPSEKSI